MSSSTAILSSSPDTTKDGSNRAPTVDVESQQPAIEPFAIPWWAPFPPMVILVLLLVAISYFFLDRDAAPYYNEYVAFGSGIFFICWYFYIGIERTYYYGVAGYYEIYWFCNVSLLLTGVGLAIRLPTLVCAAVCVVMLPHTAFWIDLICYACFRITPCGAATFLFEKGWPIHDKISTLHHFLLIPIVTFLFFRYPYVEPTAIVLAVLLLICSQVTCHYLTPREMIDKNGKRKYLNVCISHDMPDLLVNVYPFKWIKGRPAYVLFIICFFCYAIPISVICYYLFHGLQCLLNMF